MIPWVQLAAAPVEAGGALRLMRRGSEFSIMLGSQELMNSRISGSEEALADLACRAMGARERPQVLVGGLGMGFTLRAALGALGPDATVTVVELVPAVLDWARGPMAEIFGDCLADPRVQVRKGDVGACIRTSRASYDAILLDVDNGPEGLTRPGNDSLYGAAGLEAARAALRPGGVLAVWSAGPDDGFTRRLRRAAFAVEEVRVRARRPGKGARHLIWLAVRPDPAAAQA